jgi:hypothetical protein
LLNAITLFGLVMIVFYWTRRFLGPIAAVGASLLLVCQPALTLSATSAGFETFAVLFLGISLVSAWGFLKEPNADTFLLLWANLLMLSHTRYESPAYVAIILGVLLCCGYLKFSFFKDRPFIFALTPLVILPILWQRIVSLEDHETAAGVAAFGFDHLVRNALIFFQHQLNFSFTLPYATAVHLLGWVSIAMIVVGFMRGTIRFETRHALHFFVMLTGCLIFDRVIHFAYHAGDYTHPSETRYFIMPGIALVLAPVVWIVLRGWRPSVTLLALGAAAVCIYHPVAMQGELTKTLVPIQKERATSAFLKEQQPGFLLITEDSNHFTVHRFGAVNFFYANKNASQILMEFGKHAYSEILIAQDVSSNDGAIPAGQQLSGAYRLEMIREVAIQPETFVRFSRVLPARS